MSSLFQKLNLRDQRKIVVLNAPAEFESELSRLSDVAILRDASEAATIDFGLGFATTCADRDAACAVLTARASEDAILWIAYPKASSKRYASEFNRDSGWDVMRSAGFDTVRMIAIDEDWSALRFRREDQIRRPIPLRATATRRDRA